MNVDAAWLPCLALAVLRTRTHTHTHTHTYLFEEVVDLCGNSEHFPICLLSAPSPPSSNSASRQADHCQPSMRGPGIPDSAEGAQDSPREEYVQDIRESLMLSSALDESATSAIASASP